MSVVPPPPIPTTVERLARVLGASKDLAIAWSAAWAIETSLAALGLQETLAWIERSPIRRGRGDGAVVLRRNARSVALAFRLIPLRSSCLRRALVEYWLGRRRGLRLQFVIGVKHGAGFAAHAWTESDAGPATNDEFSAILRRPHEGTVHGGHGGP